MSSCDFDAPAVPLDASSSGRRRALALLAVCLAALMSGLEISSIPAILPTLEVVLHARFEDLQWIMNAYVIACTTVLMATGTLADRYGRKRVFLIAIALFGITSLVCGLAHHALVLIAARALQGAAGGAMLICLVAVLSHEFPRGAERVRAFTAWGIVFGVGLGFGPLVGGAIVAVSDWRWVFWVHVIVAAAALGIALVSVSESRDPQARSLDVRGMVALSAAVFALVWFITRGQTAGFLRVSGLCVLVAGTGSFAWFVIAQKRSAYPMFDFSVFRIRRFSGALLGSVAMNFSFWPFIVYLPIYFQGALGYDSLTSSLSLLAYTLPTLLFPPLGERLAQRYGPHVLIPGGLFVIGLGFFAMRAGCVVAGSNWLTMLPGCLIAGAGLGVVNTPVTNTTTGSVPGARAGMASGIDMSARMISLTINIALMGAILLAGVLRHLRGAWPGLLDEASLHALASRIAAGEWGEWGEWGGIGGFDTHYRGAPDAAALIPVGRAALVRGFGDVMLYGGVAACLLAAASYAVFNGLKAAGGARADT